MNTPGTLLRACRRLRSLVRFENAGFKLGDSWISNDKDTAAIREATRIYMDSWVIPIIDAIEFGDLRALDKLL